MAVKGGIAEETLSKHAGQIGDGAERGMVQIWELIDPRPYTNQSPVYGRLIFTVIDMSYHLVTFHIPT
jgi:hypothetical protein